MDQFVLDKALLSQDQQDEILFALQATLATGGAETDTLKRLSALFRREGGDWLEVDFTGWGSGRRRGRGRPCEQIGKRRPAPGAGAPRKRKAEAGISRPPPGFHQPSR